MEQPRRFVFTGSCSGVAFHIRRPSDVVLPVQAACSLPLTGGVSESSAGPGKLDKPESSIPYVSFKSATSRATGDYTDAKMAVAATRGEVPFDQLRAYTQVTTEVTGLSVLGRFEVDRAVMALQSQSTESPGQPSIQCKGVVLEGVRVDGYPLKITLAEEFFCLNDTMTKLGCACSAGENPQVFFPSNRAAAYGYGPAGQAKCTLVSAMAWEKEPHPNAVIEGNALTIPDFGVVCFGEFYISANSRNLTMVRFQLGSPDGGEGSTASGDTGNEPWPPTFP